jgi:hypothetical protein
MPRTGLAPSSHSPGPVHRSKQVAHLSVLPELARRLPVTRAGVEGAAPDAAAKALMEELYFQRACQAYLWSLPAMNCVAMEVGSAKAFGSGFLAASLGGSPYGQPTGTPVA